MRRILFHTRHSIARVRRLQLHVTTKAHRLGSSLVGRLWQASPGPRWTERGTATAEYAIATLAACGFGGVLLALMRSSMVKGFLTNVLKRALHVS